MLELELRLSAAQAPGECHRRGLMVRSERELAGRAGSHHWHLGLAGQAGTLELNAWQSRVWVKVHPLREAAGRSRWLRSLPAWGLGSRVGQRCGVIPTGQQLLERRLLGI